MRILFLSITPIFDINSRGIYTDLIRKFAIEGHEIIVLTAIERRYKNRKVQKSIKDGNIELNRLQTLNIQKTNLIEKGLSILLVESQYLFWIKRHLSQINIDLVIYATPPITFNNVVEYVKRRNNAMSYLLLKDIFPQNAVDLGLLRNSSPIYKYFKKRERDLYSISDHIGCMSHANINYILESNPEIQQGKVELNPNSISPIEFKRDLDNSISIRKKLGISSNATIFINGGNFGKPQGIKFMLEVLEAQMLNQDVFFLFVGDGTEYYQLRSWVEKWKPANAAVLKELPRNEYDGLLKSCDVGMIFLNRDFTIPNIPSRMLSYLENRIPVVAATDPHTDLGKIIEKNGFGYWSEAGSLKDINRNIERISKSKRLRLQMGKKGREYLDRFCTVQNSYDTIFNHF